jgi:prevent-host-death family protein
VAEAKKSFSNLLGKVAFGHKKIIITKRGKPIAQLSPVEEGEEKIFQAKGWREEGDPFFATVDQIVQERVEHKPRIVKGKK